MDYLPYDLILKQSKPTRWLLVPVVLILTPVALGLFGIFTYFIISILYGNGASVNPTSGDLPMIIMLISGYIGYLLIHLTAFTMPLDMKVGSVVCFCVILITYTIASFYYGRILYTTAFFDIPFLIGILVALYKIWTGSADTNNSLLKEDSES